MSMQLIYLQRVHICYTEFVCIFAMHMLRMYLIYASLILFSLSYVNYIVLARMHLMRRIAGLSQVDVDLELHDTEGEILTHITMKKTTTTATAGTPLNTTLNSA